MDSVTIEACPADRRAEALRLVFERLPEEERSGSVESLLERAATAQGTLAGLFIARRGTSLVGAAMIAKQPGRTADVWPAELTPGEDETTALALLEVCVEFALASDCVLAQALVDPQEEMPARRLDRAGFRWLTELVYVFSPAQSFPAAPPPAQFELEVYDGGKHDRLAQIVEATYEGTQDCPALNGVRDVEDVLKGYRATGGYDPSRWLLVRHAGRDVGCLLLADHEGLGVAELVYVGVVREVRGRAWGECLTRHAQWLAGAAGRQGLLAAVDAANRPALRMYTCCGFGEVRRRAVWMRILGEPAA